MQEKWILVRMGEISLKGKNRYIFEDILIKNIKDSLADLEDREIEKAYGRIYIEAKDDFKEVSERLKNVFGIVSFSLAVKTDLNMEAIEKSVLRVMAELDASTFKVDCRRPNKKFPVKSPDISRQVGGYILKNLSGWKVDIHNPQHLLEIEVRDEGAYIYTGSVPGPGGLPVRSTGKGILLLSGGIDSPVAGYLGMKRGVELIGLHFHSFPFTSQRSKEKVIDLSKELSKYCGTFKLYVNHFTEIQKEIRKKCPEKFYVTIMRRMMFRIAHRIAQKEGALAIFTGENLGQVASQTLESMRAINEVTDYPVLRPLITMDKQEIIRMAEKINTYEISIRPYEDCCTLFLPKYPATKPNVESVRQSEEELDIERLIEESLEKTEVLQVKGV
ncbi:MAG: tRNA uracil 4-sulfurtransferase [Clostridia bacterium]|jgi:thiamine biosynthesis protein ThiI|nr:thiamine biosynthesis protein ThiI [Clostridiales bacterium]MDK2985288.1 tRNA uracil 4-sulfurtransferase [Clostridia bacterium]